MAGARDDFRALLEVQPSYEPTVKNSDVLRLFDEVKAATIGKLKIKVTPADAAVRIDDRVIDLSVQSMDIELTAKSHRVVVRRDDYQDEERAVVVLANETLELPVALVRVTSTLTFRTTPADVEDLDRQQAEGNHASREGG